MQLVDALSVLLLVWNAGFYRFGSFSEQALEDCLRENWARLAAFRERNIISFSEADEAAAQELFASLSKALRRTRGGVESAVSAAKALHLLAPSIFPLWDRYIAPAYGCPYRKVPSVAYLAFTRRIRQTAVELNAELVSDDNLPRKEWLLKKTLLKRIDEYNYWKFTIPALR